MVFLFDTFQVSILYLPKKPERAIRGRQALCFSHTRSRDKKAMPEPTAFMLKSMVGRAKRSWLSPMDMPNYVECDMRVEGSIGELRRFKQFAKGKRGLFHKQIWCLI